MNRPSRSWIRLLAAVLITGAGVAPAGAATASKVKVLSRTRLGGYAEDLAYVTAGPLAKHIVFVEGYEIWGVPDQGNAKAKARKLFDLYDLDPAPRPTGIAWVDSRKLFVVNETLLGSTTQNLHFVDHKGRPKGKATMVFPLPDGYTPYWLEGMSYIPTSAGQYPDHLVMAAQNDDGSADVLIADLAGQVVKHFRPQCYDAAGNPFETAGSVEYLPGDRLAIADYNYWALCVVDFDGVASAPATFVETSEGIGEGIARLANGRIVVSEHPQTLLFFDADLDRLPELDRPYVVGLGLNNARGLAWDGFESQHLVSYVATAAASWTANFWNGPPNAIAALSPNLKTWAPIVDLTDYPDAAPGGSGFLQTLWMTFLQDEARIVLADRSRGLAPPAWWTWSPLPWFRGLLFYERGAPGPVEQIDLAPYGAGPTPQSRGRATAVAHIPGATPADGRFAVRFQVGAPSDAYTVYLFSRTGDPLGTIDFNATAGLTVVMALEYFDAPDGSGGRFAVVGSDPTSTHMQFFVTDLDGNKLCSLDIKEKLRLPTPSDVSVITTGGQAGAFAVYDLTAQTLVVFRLK